MGEVKGGSAAFWAAHAHRCGALARSLGDPRVVPAPLRRERGDWERGYDGEPPRVVAGNGTGVGTTPSS